MEGALSWECRGKVQAYTEPRHLAPKASVLIPHRKAPHNVATPLHPLCPERHSVAAHKLWEPGLAHFPAGHPLSTSSSPPSAVQMIRPKSGHG